MAFASKFADFRRIPIAQTAISSKMLAVGAKPLAGDTETLADIINVKL